MGRRLEGGGHMLIRAKETYVYLIVTAYGTYVYKFMVGLLLVACGYLI
jgi:hypothetical protein